MSERYPRELYGNLVTPFGALDFDMHFTPLYRFYFRQLTYICMRLFVFDGIPKTIDETFFKYCLIINGNACFFKLDQDILENRQSGVFPLRAGDLVVQPCNRAEMQTLYYMHRKALVTNPVFSKTYNLIPGEDCEIVYLTEPDKYFYSMYGGLFALIGRTATILADNDISINVAQKNTRLTNVVSADDKPTALSAESAIQAMYDGDPYKIAQSSLVSDLHSFPMTQTTSSREIVQLIEIRQYIYSHFYESIGIQTHDNMKRERLIQAEIMDSVDLAAINIDDMLHTVREGLQRVNALFGTSITVELNPIVKRATEQTGDELEDDTEQTGDDGSADEPEDETEQTRDDGSGDELEDKTGQTRDDGSGDELEDKTGQTRDDDSGDELTDETEQTRDDGSGDELTDETEQNGDDGSADELEDETEQTEDADIRVDEIKIEAHDDSTVIVKIDSVADAASSPEDAAPEEGDSDV